MTNLYYIDKTDDQFLLDSFSGLGGFQYAYYLLRHARESDDKYQRRQALAVYPNYVRKMVGVYMGFLWKQTPTRDVGDLYAQFMGNANGAGGKIDAVLSSYQRLAMILGTVYIIVDKPREQGATRADQTMPYMTLRMKSQLTHEEKDCAGVWTKVIFSEVDNGATVFRTFTLTEWSVSTKVDGTGVIAQGVHNLGRVPVVRLHIAKPLNPTDSRSQSWIYDLAQLCWELYNVRSELREIERNQTFPILTVPVQSDQERERLRDMTIGSENGLTYNPTGGGKPEFIAPPDAPAKHYMDRLAAIVDEIYRIANLEFVGSVQPSGDALSFHFQEINSSLNGMAQLCETAETEVAWLVYAWMGQTFDGNIAYSKEFNITDLMTELKLAMDAITLNIGQEFDKALKKRIAKQILGNDTAPSVMTGIDKEIDAGGDIYGNRIQQQAGMP